MKTLIVSVIVLSAGLFGCGQKQPSRPVSESEMFAPNLSEQERAKREEASRKFNEWTVKLDEGEKWKP